MTKKRQNTFSLIGRLLEQLVEFGLNPKDWHAEPSHRIGASIRLCHRLDEDFQLLGWIETSNPKKARWQKISVNSL